MTGKQGEMKGKRRGTERDMKGKEPKTGGVIGNESETKDKETKGHEGRCREMTGNERTGHTWKMKRTYRENDRDMKGELKGRDMTRTSWETRKGHEGESQ